jgi:hypothetical protein
MNSLLFLKNSRSLLVNKLCDLNILLNKFERISISVCNQQFKTSDSDKHVELDKNLIFPENKHNINEKADKISKAMLYYLEKLNERGNLICFYEFF